MQYKALYDLTIVQGGGTTTMELAALNRNFLYFPLNFSQYSKGKTFTGMNAHSMTKAQFDKLSSPTLKIDTLFLNDDVSQKLGEAAVFKLPFNDEGAEKAAVSSQLYQDKMVTVDWLH